MTLNGVRRGGGDRAVAKSAVSHLSKALATMSAGAGRVVWFFDAKRGIGYWRVHGPTGPLKHAQVSATTLPAQESTKEAGSSIACGTLGTCLGSPEVLYAFPCGVPHRRAGHGCFGHPAFRAPSF